MSNLIFKLSLLIINPDSQIQCFISEILKGTQKNQTLARTNKQTNKESLHRTARLDGDLTLQKLFPTSEQGLIAIFKYELTLLQPLIHARIYLAFYSAWIPGLMHYWMKAVCTAMRVGVFEENIFNYLESNFLITLYNQCK